MRNVQKLTNISFVLHRNTTLGNKILESLTDVQTIGAFSLAGTFFLITLSRSQYPTKTSDTLSFIGFGVRLLVMAYSLIAILLLLQSWHYYSADGQNICPGEEQKLKTLLDTEYSDM